MKACRRIFTVFFLVLLVCPLGNSKANSMIYDNPLINPSVNTVIQYRPLPKNVINILLLGIDDENKDYTYRKEECHSDTMIVAAIDLDNSRVDLISIPRDTMAYVPGIKGIYKMNCAINCGAKKADQAAESPEGFQVVCDTISWFLGGIKIDYYCSVNMKAMAALGDAIGGVDFNVEMAYTGTSGRRYKKGMQHLNGAGIVDYFRARKNATVQSGSDAARTDRQRDLLLEIIKKLTDDKTLLLKTLASVSQDPKISSGFFTNITDMNALSFLNVAVDLEAQLKSGNISDKIGSHIIMGQYRNAFGNWKFTFTDQENRRAIINQVYGIDVPDLDYVSYQYAKWVYENGFKAVRYLAVSDQITAAMKEKGIEADSSDKLKTAMDHFLAAYEETRDGFQAASKSMSDSDTRMMLDACKNLQKYGNEVAKLIAYPKKNGKVVWNTSVYHDEDPMINEIYVNFR